jgi:hypothetical protein
MRLFALLIALMLRPAVVAQTPAVFDLSDVVVGTKQIDTTFFLTIGKWSDASRCSDEAKVFTPSTEIHCYKAFSFCDEANAISVRGQPSLDTTSYNILRWDAKEIVAVNSEAPCIEDTLQVDFDARRVTATRALKHKPNDPWCKTFSTKDERVAFLEGMKEELEKYRVKPEKKQ